MVEAFQNAVKHGVGQAAMQLQNDGDYCVITTRNLIHESDRESITKRLNEINTLTENELKSAYFEGLRHPADGENCGLGLIFMRRKSAFPLEFNFAEMDTLRTYFYLRITLIIF